MILPPNLSKLEAAPAAEAETAAGISWYVFEETKVYLGVDLYQASTAEGISWYVVEETKVYLGVDVFQALTAAAAAVAMCGPNTSTPTETEVHLGADVFQALSE
eukprot:gene31987-33913_t